MYILSSELMTMAGTKLFSVLDLASGYWQVDLDPTDKDKTTFVTSFGLHQFRVMPFGLTNAPSTFQRLMSLVLSGLCWKTCLVYLDDIIVFSKTVRPQGKAKQVPTIIQKCAVSGARCVGEGRGGQD